MLSEQVRQRKRRGKGHIWGDDMGEAEGDDKKESGLIEVVNAVFDRSFQ